MNPDDTLSLEVHVTRGDYTRAFRRRFWRALGWIVFLGAALSWIPIWRAAALRSELAAGTPAAFVATFIAFAGAALFLTFMVELLARSFSRYALRKAPSALEPQVVTFNNQGMHARGIHVRWKDFAKAVETGSAFELQLRAGQYLLLPQRQISCADRLRALLRMHLGESAKVRR